MTLLSLVPCPNIYLNLLDMLTFCLVLWFITCYRCDIFIFSILLYYTVHVLYCVIPQVRGGIERV